MVADPADEAWLVEAQKKFDLTWFFKLRTANYLVNAHWKRSVVDVDDLPSMAERSALLQAPNFVARAKSRLRVFELRQHERRLNRRFDVISVCSAQDRVTLGLRDHLHLIPNGVAAPKVAPARNPTSPPRIGFMGLFSYEPNLQGVRWFMQHCWNHVKAQVPGVRLRLVGQDTDGPLCPQDDAVDGLGWVERPEDEVASWAATICPIQFGAGTRVKIADAFSRKCPVVSTRFGALGYEVQHGQELLLADDPREFAQACVSLIRDQAAAQQMAERAYDRFLENWSWEAITPRVLRAAEDCLRLNGYEDAIPSVRSMEISPLPRVAVGDIDPKGSSGPPRPVESAVGTIGILILIPTYNRARVLADTLSAMAASDLSGIDLEVAVIDNNSTDETSRCVTSFADKLPVVLLREPRPGKNCALNKALRERPLRDLVVFADDDITPQADWLQQMLAASSRHPDLSVFGCRVNVAFPAGVNLDWVAADWIKEIGFAWHDYGSVERLYQGSSTPMGPCFWVRRDVFSKVSCLDERIGPRPTNRIMGSEVSFLMRLEREGFRMVYCPSVQVTHRIQPGEASRKVLLRRAYRWGRGMVRLYEPHRNGLLKKNRGLWAAVLGLELLGYAGCRFAASGLHPQSHRRAELALRAMIRVGKVTESWRVAFGRTSTGAASRARLMD
jgi:glycosyltransferase involved in cell wall biosynthesis